MRKCFEHAKTLFPKPNLVVVMTDGQTPWPDEPNRDMRTIVVMTPANIKWGGSWPAPDWAYKVIQMEEPRR
jgi:hypothetical protein